MADDTMVWGLHPNGTTKKLMRTDKLNLLISLGNGWTGPVSAPPDGYTPPDAGFATVDQLTTGLQGKANLSGGKLATGELPLLALREFLGTVDNQVQMLALLGQRGDWCYRTDTKTDWEQIADTQGVLSSWREHPAGLIVDTAGAAAGADHALRQLSPGQYALTRIPNPVAAAIVFGG